MKVKTKFLNYLVLLGIVIYLCSSCNEYFESKDKSKDRQKEMESFTEERGEVPLKILPRSDLVLPTKEKDIGDVEDDLVISLDILEPTDSQRFRIFREEGRYGQVGRVEVEIEPPYADELTGVLTIKSMGKVDYLKYPVLLEGKVINERGEEFLKFERYLPLVFGKSLEITTEEVNSPVINFGILRKGTIYNPGSFLLHAEIKAKILDLSSEVNPINLRDFSNIGVKEETVILSNPLRITFK